MLQQWGYREQYKNTEDNKKHRNKKEMKPKKEKNKKSQLKIQEMAFFLVAIVLFFILVGLFAFSLVFSNLGKGATAAAEERTLSSITNLADAPEFSCGEPNCVDADKILALIQNKKYQNFWPFSSLSVQRQSTFTKNESQWVVCTATNYPNCDVFEIYNKNVRNERAISNYVALCRVELENNYNYKRCEIAKLVAGTELKNAGG